MQTTRLAPPEPFFRDPAAGPTLNVLGVPHRYMATGAETGGAFSLWESVYPPESTTPPHTHTHEDEAFYMLDGELLVEVEGEAAPHRVATGGFFFGARGRRHAIRNVGNRPARVLILCTPSVGLDRMFAELDAVTRTGMPKIETVAAITAKYGVTIAPADA
jgi:quercetin dioxygenase-like cupin family protein